MWISLCLVALHCTNIVLSIHTEWVCDCVCVCVWVSEGGRERENEWVTHWSLRIPLSPSGYFRPPLSDILLLILKYFFPFPSHVYSMYKRGWILPVVVRLVRLNRLRPHLQLPLLSKNQLLLKILKMLKTNYVASYMYRHKSLMFAVNVQWSFLLFCCCCCCCVAENCQ